VAERKAFPLRLDRAVYDAVRRWADDELRSVNAQIEFILREALLRRGRLKEETDGQYLPQKGGGRPEGPGGG
jgi:hypothetical protein